MTNRLYMRGYRKRKIDRRNNEEPPAKPTKELHRTDPKAYRRQYQRWWSWNGHTARL